MDRKEYRMNASMWILLIVALAVRGDVTALLAGYPAPPGIGAQMTTQGTICKMVAKCTQQGKSINEAIDFAQSELESFRRS